jgi:hypothetical protein
MQFIQYFVKVMLAARRLSEKGKTGTDHDYFSFLAYFIMAPWNQSGSNTNFTLYSDNNPLKHASIPSIEINRNRSMVLVNWREDYD